MNYGPTFFMTYNVNQLICQSYSSHEGDPCSSLKFKIMFSVVSKFQFIIPDTEETLLVIQLMT